MTSVGFAMPMTRSFSCFIKLTEAWAATASKRALRVGK